MQIISVEQFNDAKLFVEARVLDQYIYQLADLFGNHGAILQFNEAVVRSEVHGPDRNYDVISQYEAALKRAIDHKIHHAIQAKRQARINRFITTINGTYSNVQGN